ncbi:hypothetical protein GPECTOR_16g724 [Gonium pectorale]|uniref:Thiaminase-2/PQQC domain-containing protein n=1 Tax=Gonium pectorale TaxID=33097 RepID=A0A150GL22_GONPE|nr:hypothetical protein GPECTOR_16g724 [Gonium pectorale]|eukprot:KXZ50549.1 hypothetical protein GPECTOR_16g724 [Gonium pectorale]
MAPATTKSLIEGCGEAWKQATLHPFLDAVADGSIKPEQFNTWLVQDYHFVRAFVRFTATTMASAPDAHMATLLGGMAVLQGELAWFREKAAQRGLDLDGAELQPACRAYRDLMAELQYGPGGAAATGGSGGAPYAVKAAAFWAIEACYNTAWGGLLGRTGPEYSEYVSRWGSPEFGQYVEVLAAQADAALAQEGPEVAASAAEVVKRIADLEVRFWGMAYGG